MAWGKIVVVAVGVIGALVVTAIQYYRRRQQEHQHEQGSGGWPEGEGPGDGEGGREEGGRRTSRSEEGKIKQERSHFQTVRRRRVRRESNDTDNGAGYRQIVTVETRQRRDESESRRGNVPTRHTRDEEVIHTEETSLVKTTEESEESDVLINSGNSVDIYRREALAQPSFSRKKINRSQETKMEVPTNNVGVWKFGEENFFTSVPKVWTVSDCIAHVQNTIGRHGYGVLDLWIKNRCIMLDKTKSLSDYPGLKSLHVVRRPTSRDPHPLHQTSRVDDTDPYCEDTCVGMCCGHAISPDNLYNYVWQKIKNGATEVTCPAIPDATKPGEQCSNVWEFKSISMLACLSDDENYLFCDKLFSNWLEKEADVYICPTCYEAIHSSCVSVFKCFYCEQGGKSHSFCVKCNRAAYGNFCFNNECQESLPKVKALLEDCRMRTIIGVPNCPSVRACPVCQCVIEFEEEDLCKHMTCPKNTCKAQFCFICLKVKTDKYYYPCGGAFEPCQPTPRQII